MTPTKPSAGVEQSFTVAASPELVEALPGGSSGTSSGTGTLSFSSTGSPGTRPNNAFKLVGAPKVNRHTGAVTFSVHVSDPGALTWVLTFRKRSSGGHAAIFASGRRAAEAPGAIAFAARPRPLAEGALRSAGAKRKSLALKATLGFHSARGGMLTSGRCSRSQPAFDNCRVPEPPGAAHQPDGRA